MFLKEFLGSYGKPLHQTAYHVLKSSFGSIYLLQFVSGKHMILSDVSIREEIEKGTLVVDPFIAEHIQPSSLDLRLGTQFQILKRVHQAYIDIRKPVTDYMELVEVADGEAIAIHPGEFVLGTTIEDITFPDYLVGRLEGRSSLGRVGIIVHSTAGYFDPGFSGQCTLEITNLGSAPVLLYTGMRVAQMSFYQMTTPAEHPYGSDKLKSKYQRQQGPTISRIHEDFD